RLEELRSHFSHILRPQGEINLSRPLPEEMDETEIIDLPRLVLDFDKKNFGRLNEFIDCINHD
ncbi:MAG: Rossman fold protein, TIGR00730 family, partial [Deltaproteobacteria bacterium]|nr:Rossman fold protein, TIGR00730 family [Deltaproteobacteria bacterium]